MTTYNNYTPNRAELEHKFFKLVWFARSDPDTTDPVVRSIRNELKEQYPDEIERLAEGGGDWEHGFNSGMLACLRLLSSAKITKNNRNEFPFLDT